MVGSMVTHKPMGVVEIDVADISRGGGRLFRDSIPLQPLKDVHSPRGSITLHCARLPQPVYKPGSYRALRDVALLDEDGITRQRLPVDSGAKKFAVLEKSKEYRIMFVRKVSDHEELGQTQYGWVKFFQSNGNQNFDGPLDTEVDATRVQLGVRKMSVASDGVGKIAEMAADAAEAQGTAAQMTFRVFGTGSGRHCSVRQCHAP